MLLLALAVAPGLAICILLLYRDIYNREPPFTLIVSFLLGMCAIIPALMVELAINPYFDKSIASIIINSYLGVALIEEFSKYIALRYYSFGRKSFDEPLDGIIHSVLISMGFATLENIGYVFEHGLSVAFMRMFTSVPAHATFAIIMGYYVGKAKFDLVNRKRFLGYGLLAATFVHGTYDCFLFLLENKWLKQYISELLLVGGALASLIIAVRLSMKLIKLHRLTSQQLFKSAPVWTIRHAGEADLATIRNLALDVWPQTYSGILSPAQINYMLQQIYSVGSLKNQFRDQHQFIIIYNSGVPVGFASYSEVEPSVYKLHKLYILPLHQGRGTGRFALEQIIRDIKPKGATALQLNVNRHNTAKAFYESLGFEVLRSEDIDIGNGFFMNDYVMEKRLVAAYSIS